MRAFKFLSTTNFHSDRRALGSISRELENNACLLRASAVERR